MRLIANSTPPKISGSSRSSHAPRANDEFRQVLVDLVQRKCAAGRAASASFLDSALS
jgi:hypothetical protein